MDDLKPEPCSGSEYEDEYSSDKKAYRHGKDSYSMGLRDPSACAYTGRLRDMWNMGYNYMHAMDKV